MYASRTNIDNQSQEKLFKKSKALSQKILLYATGSKFVTPNPAACILRRDGGVRKNRELNRSMVWILWLKSKRQEQELGLRARPEEDSSEKLLPCNGPGELLNIRSPYLIFLLYLDLS